MSTDAPQVRERQYRTQDVPVAGGRLRVGVWEPVGVPAAGTAAADAPTVLCIHGITSSHPAWAQVAGLLPDWRVIAPDLRGRGRSSALPGPYGLARHAEDVRSAATALAGSLSRVVVVGHSMGAFVAVALLGALPPPEAPAGLVLVDGGIPLPVPAGTSGGEEAIRSTLGPTAERLRRTFVDAADHRAFWAAHPALAGPWPPGLAEYFDYDLRPDGSGAWRPSTDEAAMLADGVEIAAPGGSPELRRGLAALSARWGPGSGRRPVELVRAPRDLVDRPGGMYPPDWAAARVAEVPGLVVRDVPDTNHYTLLLGSVGAAEVARAVRATVDDGGAGDGPQGSTPAQG